MKEKFLNSLVDPLTREELRLEGSLDSGVLKGSQDYKIVNGVPRFVEDKSDKTIESFSNKWKNNVMEKYSSDYLTQICAILGSGNKELSEIKYAFCDGFRLLDAGCGLGWIESYFNMNKKVDMYAIDKSDSVDRAYERTRNEDNIFVAQADIFKLPFRQEYFDTIICNGVLHHTPNPRMAFYELCNYLRFGGTIGIYVYCVKPFARELLDREIRKITTNLSYRECVNFSNQLSKLGRTLRQSNEKVKIDFDIPMLGIEKGEYSVQEFLYNFFMKCYYNEEEGLEYSTFVNYDWYGPEIASHHKLEEILLWFEECNINRRTVIQPSGFKYSGYFVSGVKEVVE